MPNDYITLNALSNELDSILKNGKIDKITMPEKDEINVFIRANNKNYNLAVSCNASNPRIHLTNVKKISPLSAPSFCMHLRKHLLNGIIQSISTINEDRIIVLDILSHNEMRDPVQYKLIIEMMGRYSNIIVANEKEIITDVLKQVPFDMMTKRTLIPSAKYIVPEQTKLSLSNKEQIEAALKQYMGNNLVSFLLSIVSGLASSTAEEIIFQANVENSTSPLSDEDIENILISLNRFSNIYNSKLYNPCVEINDNNTPSDYYVMKYHKIKNIISKPSLNEAIEYTLSLKDEKFRQEEKTKYLTKAYNAFLSKCNKKLEKSKQRFNEAQDKDHYKLIGELIIANIYRIKKGDESITVQNYYSSDLEDIKIKLDETLAPQQNAQVYFKKYTKLKHQEEIALEQIEELEETIEYLKSIEPYISRCKTQQDIKEIHKELEEIGALKSVKDKKSKKEKESSPITYNVKGFEVLIGKNNLQNDKISFKIANGGDIWMHVKSFHGSHGIIITKGQEVPNDVLLIACEICAYFSNTGDEKKVEIDYTFRKNVKRHPSKKPGMVLYDTYNSIVVEPIEHKEYLK